MNRIIYGLLFLMIATNVYGDGDRHPLLIEKALDEPASIRLKQITLEDVFVRLSQQIGVMIDLEQAGPALDQLPYGRLTQIESAQIQGLSWRNALKELLKPFSLTFQAGNDRIYILGTPELMRQPQRLVLTRKMIQP